MNSRNCGQALLWIFAVLLAPIAARAADGESPASPGSMILYRQGSFTAHFQKFDVLVDGKSVGALKDSSALRLRASPGNHRVSVRPGGVAKESSSIVNFEPATEKYSEYSFVTGPLYNLYFVGSAIEVRSQEKAQADMKTSGIEQIEDVVVGSAPASAEVDNADAVPLNEAGKQAYREWLKQPKPRAFVIASQAVWEATSGFRANSGRDPGDPVLRALQNCRWRRAGDCKVYAFDDFVVWGDAAGQ